MSRKVQEENPVLNMVASLTNTTDPKEQMGILWKLRETAFAEVHVLTIIYDPRKQNSIILSPSTALNFEDAEDLLNLAALELRKQHRLMKAESAKSSEGQPNA